MLKGPKRSFVVVVLLLVGVESSSKNVTKVTKNVREQNLLQSEQNFLQREQKKFANQICSKWNKNLYKVSRKMCGNENSSKLDGKEIKLWPCAT